MSAGTITELEEKLDQDNKGPEVAHYAEKTSVTEGYVLGSPVIAICGQVFVPSRDPENLPICQECSEIIREIYA